MTITPEPVIATVEFDECDKLHRIMVKDEKVFDFDLSQRWFVSTVSVTKNRNQLVITLKRGEECPKQENTTP